MEIEENIYKIKNYANIYIITKPIPTIIDTGLKKNEKKIIKKIEKIIPLKDIKIVLLTHLHYDHSGNIDIFPNAKIYLSKEELDYYKKNPNHFSREPFSEKIDKILMKKAKPLPRKISGLEVIKSPGHTSGCVCFIDKKNNLIFTGDTLFCKGIGRTDLPNSNHDQMKFTISKLINLIDKYNLKLCPGHDEF